MSRFLKPNVVRLNLKGGDFIIVKRELTAGEQRRAFARTTKPVKHGQPIELDLEKVGISNLVEYLVDWSFVDENGAPVGIKDMPQEYVADVLNSLDADSFAEISEAIDEHERTVAEEKKTRSTANAS